MIASTSSSRSPLFFFALSTTSFNSPSLQFIGVSSYFIFGLKAKNGIHSIDIYEVEGKRNPGKVEKTWT